MFQTVFQFKWVFLIFTLCKVSQTTFNDNIYDGCECSDTPRFLISLINKNTIDAFTLIAEPLNACCYPTDILMIRDKIANLISNNVIQIDLALLKLQHYNKVNRYDLLISFFMLIRETLPTNSYIKPDLDTLINYLLKRKYLNENYSTSPNYDYNVPQRLDNIGPLLPMFKPTIFKPTRPMELSNEPTRPMELSYEPARPFEPSYELIRPLSLVRDLVEPYGHPRTTQTVMPKYGMINVPALHQSKSSSELNGSNWDKHETCDGSNICYTCQSKLIDRIISIIGRFHNINPSLILSDSTIKPAKEVNSIGITRNQSDKLNINNLIQRLLSIFPEPKYPLEKEYYNILVQYLYSAEVKPLLNQLHYLDTLDNYDLLKKVTDLVLKQTTDFNVISAFNFYKFLVDAIETNFIYLNLKTFLPKPTNYQETIYYQTVVDFLASKQIYQMIILHFTRNEDLSEIFVTLSTEVLKNPAMPASIVEAFNFYLMKHLAQTTETDYSKLVTFLPVASNLKEINYYKIVSDFLRSPQIDFYLPSWKFNGISNRPELFSLVLKEIAESPNVPEHIKEAFKYYYTTFKNNPVGIDRNELINYLSLPTNDKEQQYYEKVKLYLSTGNINVFLHDWKNKSSQELYHMLLKEISKTSNSLPKDIMEAFNYYYLKDMNINLLDFNGLLKFLPTPNSSTEMYYYNIVKSVFESPEIYSYIPDLHSIISNNQDLERLYKMIVEKLAQSATVPSNVLQAFNYYYRLNLIRQAQFDYSNLVKFLPLPTTEEEQFFYNTAKTFLESTQIYQQLPFFSTTGDLQEVYKSVVERLKDIKTIPTIVSDAFKYYHDKILKQQSSFNFKNLIPLLPAPINTNETVYFETIKNFLTSHQVNELFNPHIRTVTDNNSVLTDILTNIMKLNVSEDLKQADLYLLSKLVTEKFGYNYLKLLEFIPVEDKLSRDVFITLVLSKEFEKIASEIKYSDFKSDEQLFNHILMILQKITVNEPVRQMVNVYLINTSKLVEYVLKLLPTPKTEADERYYNILKVYLESGESYQNLKDIDMTLFDDDKFLLDLILRRISASFVSQNVLEAVNHYLELNENPAALDLITKKEIKRRFKLTEIFTDTLNLKDLSIEEKSAFRAFFKFISEIKPDSISNFDSWDQAHTRGEFMKLLFEYFVKSDIPDKIKECILILQPLVQMNGKGALPP